MFLTYCNCPIKYFLKSKAIIIKKNFIKRKEKSLWGPRDSGLQENNNKKKLLYSQLDTDLKLSCYFVGSGNTAIY